MKILFTAQRFHNNMYYPVKALVKAGHGVKFWSMYEQMSEMHDVVKPEILKRSPLDFIFKRITNKNNNLKTKISLPCFPMLGWKLFRYNPDLVLIKDTQNFLSVFMLIWCAILRKKSYLLVQTDEYVVKSKIKKVFVWILRNICCVKGVISPLKDKTGVFDPFFVYIPFVYQVEEVKKEHFKNNKINIIDIGKFQKRKDHLLLIKAVESLRAKYDINLTIIGEKMDENIKEAIYDYVSENKLNDIIKVFVDIEPGKMKKFYLDSDLYVLPSYDEPAAFSIVEAMACGLPIIVSDTCGTKCYVEEGKNGYIFRSKDVDDLSNKIEEAIKDRNNLIKMGKSSYDIASNDHSCVNFVNSLEKLIKSTN